jgi:hypothetical protein
VNNLAISRHAVVRLAQRGIRATNAELIALIGTEIDDGYVVLTKDYQQAEAVLKNFLDRLRRVVGKRLVVADGRIITAYHLRKNVQRRLLRAAHDRDLGS